MAEPVNERVRKRRAALRRAGMRPVQIWVTDTRRPAFAAECRRQARALRGDPQEAETLAWIESVAETEGWR